MTPLIGLLTFVCLLYISFLISLSYLTLKPGNDVGHEPEPVQGKLPLKKLVEVLMQSVKSLNKSN